MKREDLQEQLVVSLTFERWLSVDLQLATFLFGTKNSQLKLILHTDFEDLPIDGGSAVARED